MTVYSYLIMPYDVTATIDAADGDDAQPIAYTGNLAGTVQARLEFAYGAFGHGFNVGADTPIDLHHALISTFGADAIADLGEPLEYAPNIPDGVLT